MSAKRNPWNTIDGWIDMAARLDLRVRHAGEPGHAGWCVLADPSSASVRDALACTRAVPLLLTNINRRMEAEIDDLIENSSGNPLDREVLMLDGPAFFGKTVGTMLPVLKRSRGVWKRDGMWIPGLEGVSRRFPWVYVEVGQDWGYRGLLAQTQKFLGLLPGENDTGERRLRNLEEKLVEFGVEGAVVDDAHRLRQIRDARSVDGLKSMFSLPIEFVFVGLEPLEETALLAGANTEDGNKSAEQIDERREPVHRDLGLTPEELRSDWDTWLEELTVQFHIPEHRRVEFLSDRVAREVLYTVSDGRYGRTYRVMRDAAVDSIRKPKTTLLAAVVDHTSRMEKRHEKVAVDDKPFAELFTRAARAASRDTNSRQRSTKSSTGRAR